MNIQDIKGQAETDGLDLDIDMEHLVEEHEEEVSEGGQTVRRKGIFLLPNLFTTGALFAGFYAMIAAVSGDFDAASMAIVSAMIFDGLDGRVARLTNTSSKFGAEYDSLSDMVSFGIAPALVVYCWGLGELGKFGWSVAFIYVACAALRLARFNTRIEVADRTWFTGLSSPAAAGGLAVTVWVCHDIGWVGANLPVEISIAVAALTALVAILMIAKMRFYSFKTIDLRRRVPFVAAFAMVLIFALVTVDPPRVLLTTFVLYVLSGFILLAVHGNRQD